MFSEKQYRETLLQAYWATRNIKWNYSGGSKAGPRSKEIQDERGQRESEQSGQSRTCQEKGHWAEGRSQEPTHLGEQGQGGQLGRGELREKGSITLTEKETNYFWDSKIFNIYFCTFHVHLKTQEKKVWVAAYDMENSMIQQTWIKEKA